MNEVREMDHAPKEKGYVWGKIWCVLAFIAAIGFVVFGIMFLATSPYTGPSISIGILFLILAIIYGLDGWGMWIKKGWALVLTYALLAISFVSAIVQFISLFISDGIWGGSIAGWLITLLVKIAIDILWFCYFYKRRREFN